MNNPLSNSIATYILRTQDPHPPTVYLEDPFTAQAQSIHGFFCTAVGISYCLSFYKGWEEFLYLSIPVRLGLGLVGLGTAIIAPERLSPLFVFLWINDALSGIYGAFAMGWNWLGEKNWKENIEGGANKKE